MAKNIVITDGNNGSYLVDGKDLNSIKGIEALTFAEAKALCTHTNGDQMEIKEHQCFFVELNGYFGYSVLVYNNEHHIYYANDYELHHSYQVKEHGKASLKPYYIDALNDKLYTEDELMSEIKSYHEYDKKTYFMYNYYLMRYNHMSAWYIGEPSKELLKWKRKGVFSNVGTCYVETEEIANKAEELYSAVRKQFKALKENMETFREMISYELANHEACITMDYHEALASLGLSWKMLSDEQKRITKAELNKQIEAYC